MSEGEALILFGSLVFSVVAWPWLVIGSFRVSSLHSTFAFRTWLLVAPIAAAAVILYVLRTLASFDVRGDVRYLWMYSALGMTWAYLASGPWIGFSVRDDIVERANVAALIGWTGAVVGSAACYAGANVGDGPGWWCVVWSGCIGTLGHWMSWAALHHAARIGDHVTIDRDVASGIRAAAFLIAAGVMWGRGAAGDWTSAIVTLVDFKVALPGVLLLLAKAWAIERFVAPTAKRPVGHWIAHGLAPASLDLAIVIIALHSAGPLHDHYVISGTP